MLGVGCGVMSGGRVIAQTIYERIKALATAKQKGWWLADDATVVGGKITRVANQFTGPDVVQANAALQPATGVIGSRLDAVFANDSLYSEAAIDLSAYTSATLAWYAHRTTTDAWQVPACFGDKSAGYANGGMYAMHQDPASNLVVMMQDMSGNMDSRTLGSTDTNPHSLVFSYDTTQTAANQAKVWVDGAPVVLAGAGFDVTGVFGNHYVIIGDLRSWATAYPFAGSVPSVLLFAPQLTAAEAAELGALLAQYYGL